MAGGLAEFYKEHLHNAGLSENSNPPRYRCRHDAVHSPFILRLAIERIVCCLRRGATSSNERLQTGYHASDLEREPAAHHSETPIARC